MTSWTTLDAVLERITYANEETGYTVARVATDRSGTDLLTVVGPLLGAQVGESLRLTGWWRSHPKYGRQFEVRSYETVLPATEQGIRRYLGSGMIKGIGPVLAGRMVDRFGTEILQVIEDEPDRLREVAGLGVKRVARINAAWAEQKAIKEVMVFLQGVGVSTSIAVRIYQEYGDASIATVRRDPYKLAADVWGVGFKTADTIARAIGIPHDSPSRVQAGLRHALSQAADNGHCFLPEPELLAASARLLDVPRPYVAAGLDELADAGAIVRETVPARAWSSSGSPVRAVYLLPFHRAESSLARRLCDLLRSAEDRLGRAIDWDRAMAWLRSRTGVELADEQQAAVRLAFAAKVAVLTGGPGCGKSFTVRSIVELASAMHARVVLAAPTGRAARRLTELTGHEAATIHRLLQLQPGGQGRFNRDNPLEADLVVIDECSMVDLILANKLVKAIPPGAHLLLVGDVDQLPSVGPGSVLADLLAAPIPTIRLTRVFRQAQESGIVANAHRVNAGRPLITSGQRDFFLFPSDDPAHTVDLTVELVSQRIARRFGLDPRRDIQVLTPMHRGPAGAVSLSARLQEALTPHRDGRPERRVGARVFRIGDKVIQLRNNYDKGAAGVFNGTVGVVTAISLEDQCLTVHTDEDETIPYSFAELDELGHAYAITIHRSQGSEYPAVVIPFTAASRPMLQRNLLYTAITRAKQLVVLVGPHHVLTAAIRTVGSAYRHTGLPHRLTPATGSPEPCNSLTTPSEVLAAPIGSSETSSSPSNSFECPASPTGPPPPSALPVGSSYVPFGLSRGPCQRLASSVGWSTLLAPWGGPSEPLAMPASPYRARAPPIGSSSPLTAEPAAGSRSPRLVGHAPDEPTNRPRVGRHLGPYSRELVRVCRRSRPQSATPGCAPRVGLVGVAVYAAAILLLNLLRPEILYLYSVAFAAIPVALFPVRTRMVRDYVAQQQNRDANSKATRSPRPGSSVSRRRWSSWPRSR